MALHQEWTFHPPSFKSIGQVLFELWTTVASEAFTLGISSKSLDALLLTET